MENVNLISLTPRAEEVIAYCARVSNPRNQDNANIAGLLKYCATHGHWSIFEQANMLLEIGTSRAIAPQILRHRSFSFQEFSQRYAAADTFIPFAARRQDEKDPQNSIADLDEECERWFAEAQRENWRMSYALYEQALRRGIAKECARALLPLGTTTKIYMNGTIRSWIHYIETRTHPATQLEHRDIAERCRQIFTENLPLVSKALGWL